MIERWRLWRGVKSLRESELRIFERSSKRPIKADHIKDMIKFTARAGESDFDHQEDQLLKKINDALKKGDCINISIDGLREGILSKLSSPVPLPRISNDNFWQIGSISTSSLSVELSELAVHTISGRGRGQSKFYNCYIGTIDLSSGHPDCSFNFQNCLIGSIVFEKHRPITNLSLKNCRVQSITVPNFESSKYIITNDLRLDGTIFETSDKSVLFLGAQSFRNLRINMAQLENSVAAAHLRRHELRTERPGDPLATGFVSWLYDVLSEYGANTTRSFLWLLLIWGISALLVALFDGGEIALPLETYVGWKESMIFEDAGGRFVRSLWLSIQATFSPLAFLGYKQMVVAKFGVTKILLIFQGLFTDGILLMLIFGLRKRFKLN